MRSRWSSGRAGGRPPGWRGPSPEPGVRRRRDLARFAAGQAPLGPFLASGHGPKPIGGLAVGKEHPGLGDRTPSA